ncbi:MAG TPA: hypothetical protein VM165_20995 [Planctomycetaceae bacterium]|nr:hypothetical protein [Planctomycetaceae bacterium]
MSRIHVECPDCNGTFDVKAMRAGHRVQCKLCGSVVRVPLASQSVSDEPARDEAAVETRTVLKRRSFSESGDALYDDIFDDTSEVTTRRSFGAPRLQLSRQTLLLISGGLVVLLAIYVAFQAGRSSAPVTMPPAPIVPITPMP